MGPKTKVNRQAERIQVPIAMLVINANEFPLPFIFRNRPAEADYAEAGCTRGAGLRLDWRRTFLSLGGVVGFKIPCQSVGRP